MSSTYVAAPVISRGSSRRRILFPTSVSALVIVVAILRSRHLRRRLHRVDDVLIPRAPADIAFQPFANFFFRRIRIAIENLFRRDDHPRRAEPALQTMLVPERLLYFVQLPTHGQPFDGEHVRSVGLHGEHRAALYGFAV